MSGDETFNHGVLDLRVNQKGRLPRSTNLLNPILKEIGIDDRRSNVRLEC